MRRERDGAPAQEKFAFQIPTYVCWWAPAYLLQCKHRLLLYCYTYMEYQSWVEWLLCLVWLPFPLLNQSIYDEWKIVRLEISEWHFMNLLSLINKAAWSYFIVSHHGPHLESCAFHYLILKEVTEEFLVKKMKKKIFVFKESLCMRFRIYCFFILKNQP